MGETEYKIHVTDPGGEPVAFTFWPKQIGTYTVKVTPIEDPKPELKPLAFFGRELRKISETRLELQTETFNVVSAKDVDGWYAGLRKGQCCQWSALSETYNDPASAIAALERICISEFNFWDEVVPDGEWLNKHVDA